MKKDTVLRDKRHGSKTVDKYLKMAADQKNNPQKEEK